MLVAVRSTGCDRSETEPVLGRQPSRRRLGHRAQCGLRRPDPTLTPIAEQSSARCAPGGRMLEVHDLTVRFGGITALDGVGFSVGAGEMVGLIGPNGAGKTTLFNCLTRRY